MITVDKVRAAMQRWECAGLVPPQKPEMLIRSFMERFSYMDEPTLAYISDKVVLGDSWPQFQTVKQLAKEFEDKNTQYCHIDYFKQQRLKAFGEKESFEEFLTRIAEEYFPGRGEEWREKYAFSLYYYGVCCRGCAQCEGVCPHNGHRIQLRLKRGTDCPVPWGSLELCEKYHMGVDAQGRKRPRASTVKEQATAREEALAGAEAAECSFEDAASEAYSEAAKATQQEQRRRSSRKPEQLEMFNADGGVIDGEGFTDDGGAVASEGFTDDGGVIDGASFTDDGGALDGEGFIDDGGALDGATEAGAAP